MNRHMALTEKDMETLRALYAVGPYPGAAAAHLRIHVNTLKYRLVYLRRVYGLKPHMDAWAVLRTALERGDLVLDERQEPYTAALQEAARRDFGPLGPMLACWLGQEARRWVAGHSLTDVAA